MAPSKNAKRSAAVASMPIMDASPKKQHLDPKFAGILATLQNAEHLNDPCRAMLVAFTKGLSTPKTLRHAAQSAGVAMIEEALQDARKKFADAAALAQEERSKLEGVKDSSMARVKSTEAALDEKQAVQSTAQAALDEAQGAMNRAEVALASAKEAVQQSEGPLAALEKESAALGVVFQEHFKAPMENGQGPRFNFLEPFTENLGLEESLIKALPSSCVKTKEQRGGFDDLVIAEFEKALVAKMAALAKSIADEVPAAAARKQAVASAELELASRLTEGEAAAAEVAAATAVRAAAEAELLQAKEECVAHEPCLEQAISKHTSLQAELEDFEKGTLANFESLRDTEVQEEVAAAGA